MKGQESVFVSMYACYTMWYTGAHSGETRQQSLKGGDDLAWKWHGKKDIFLRCLNLLWLRGVDLKSLAFL